MTLDACLQAVGIPVLGSGASAPAGLDVAPTDKPVGYFLGVPAGLPTARRPTSRAVIRELAADAE